MVKNLITAEKFAARLKQADLVKKKTDFDNKLTRFNKPIISYETQYLEIQKKLNSLMTKDYNFFLVRISFTSNDGTQNIFGYHLTFDILELKNKTKALIIFIVRNQKKYLILNFRKYILLSYLALKFFGYRIGIKFNKDPLAVEQSNYLTKVVNVCIVCDLDAWPRSLTNNLKFKNFLFEVTNIVNNSDKEK